LIKRRTSTNNACVSKATPRPVKVLTMLLVPVIGFAIASCGDSGTREPYAGIPEGKPPGLGAPVPDPKEVLETKSKGALPDFLANLTGPKKDRVTGLYQGALDHYDAYGHIPCYCGCAIYTTPHNSLAQCFIKDIAQDGSATFTDHSTSCDICEGIAQLTVEGIAVNKPLKDIRTEVFNKYDYTGIWTDTPPIP
jgi:Protein of unknown function with PCYCGC motif